MTPADPDLSAIAQAGVAALRRGDGQEARAAFERVEAAGRATPQLRLFLAQACQMLGDHPAAHHALDQVLSVEPDNLYALILHGDLHRSAGNPRAAVSWYQTAITHAPRAGSLPPDLIKALHRAEAAVAEESANFQAYLDHQFVVAGIAPPQVSPRFVEALDILASRAAPQLQRPTSFYYPALAPRPFFDRDDFAWVTGLEAAAPAIRAELAVLLADNDAVAPYVVADPSRPTKRHVLLDDDRWSAVHLLRDGVPVRENVARCPRTMEALATVGIPTIRGRSPTAMFSVLRPHTHIPPHTGMLNTRLICHLPLIVPENCRLRVGNETQQVMADRMMIFDDSIEHEAWNDSDATRVVLLFEIWRPDLDTAERAALTTLFEAIGRYAPAPHDQGGA
ncbi:aspartyl/asparaginyl beta-hydroxylase domain-containing protein [Sphingomonas qilianensis]|uniref:Aspartyl/asparaginyl beta-hydroxylase domain-containing protein n=1 Tax=Sphingomonas qilianensis TaxID=1736690 RepID=A0ABU9XSL1_9SPHN